MIVPRWEWRTFGDTFGDAEARLAALPATRLDDSREQYILSNRVEGSIKIRGGKLDVKRLERRSEDGLEQWRPVANAEFPIAATDIALLLNALEATVPPLDREAYALDQLIDEVVAPQPELLSVPVRKNRVHRVLDGCRTEVTQIRSRTTDDADDCRRGRGSGARPLDGRGARAVVAAERQRPPWADPTARPPQVVVGVKLTLMESRPADRAFRSPPQQYPADTSRARWPRAVGVESKLSREDSIARSSASQNLSA